jgi:hypothetical protein
VFKNASNRVNRERRNTKPETKHSIHRSVLKRHFSPTRDNNKRKTYGENGLRAAGMTNQAAITRMEQLNKRYDTYAISDFFADATERECLNRGVWKNLIPINYLGSEPMAVQLEESSRKILQGNPVGLEDPISSYFVVN